MAQMLLVVAALTILSMLTFTVNSSILQAYVISYDSEATIDAMSIGQAMLDEIQTQAFDSLTNTTQTVKNPNLCTIPSKLGADIDSEKTFASVVAVYPDTMPFKSMEKFNDVDDYNRYKRLVKSPHLGNFTVEDSVSYVLDSDLNTPYKITPTWYKKVLVKISHPSLYRPIEMKSLIVFRKYFGHP